MSDIAERLLAAIQAEEDTVPPLFLDGRYVGPRTEAERQLLRQCTRDRRIIEVHRPGDDGLCVACGLDGQNEDCTFPCDIIRNRARGYGVQPTPGDDHA